MAFRSWDLYEFPLLQSTTKYSWTIKTATQLEKPRYDIFAIQTDRKNVMSEDISRFDNLQLSNRLISSDMTFFRPVNNQCETLPEFGILSV